MSDSVIVLDGTKIVRVEASGLTYLDEADIEQFISFEKCYETYLHRKLNPQSRQERNLSDLNGKTTVNE